MLLGSGCLKVKVRLRFTIETRVRVRVRDAILGLWSFLGFGKGVRCPGEFKDAALFIRLGVDETPNFFRVSTAERCPADAFGDTCHFNPT